MNESDAVVAQLYWRHFTDDADESGDHESLFDAWIRVERACASGSHTTISLLIALAEASPAEADGWLSYFVSGPVGDFWRSTDATGRALLRSAAAGQPRLQLALDVLMGSDGYRFLI